MCRECLQACASARTAQLGYRDVPPHAHQLCCTAMDCTMRCEPCAAMGCCVHAPCMLAPRVIDASRAMCLSRLSHVWFLYSASWAKPGLWHLGIQGCVCTNSHRCAAFACCVQGLSKHCCHDTCFAHLLAVPVLLLRAPALLLPDVTRNQAQCLGLYCMQLVPACTACCCCCHESVVNLLGGDSPWRR